MKTTTLIQPAARKIVPLFAAYVATQMSCALGQDFHNRGARSEEQVQLLRELWASPLITFHGKWHKIPDAGLNPLPVQREIPVWFGGHAEAVLRRIAKLGDGWLPNYKSIEEVQPPLEKLYGYLENEGRSRDSLGIEVRLNYGDGDLAVLTEAVDRWRKLGVTHISFNTMRSGFETSIQHIGAMRRIGECADLMRKS